VTVIPDGKASPARTEESLTISETSRDVSRSTRCARSGQALNVAAAPLLNGCNVTLPLDMTKGLFASLNVYHDIASRSAAVNMAIDEALLETAEIPTIRFIHGIIQRSHSAILENLRTWKIMRRSVTSPAAGPVAELFFMAMI